MVQQWWNDIVQWITSTAGRELITTAILPFVAILLGGLIAGLIIRSAIKRLLAQQDRAHKTAAVASLIAAGRKAATWSTLSAPEKDHVDHQASEAEVRVRLLPVTGANLAADWAAHHLAAMKKNSANYSFQAEQDLVDFQQGLIEWQSKPNRARKLFAQDLAAWKYDAAVPVEDDLSTKQREWAATQAATPNTEQTAVIPEPASR
jgi:hypothetical protein